MCSWTKRGEPGRCRGKRHWDRSVVVGNLGRSDIYYPFVSAINPFDREVGATPAVDKSWAYITMADLAKLMDATPSRPWRSLLALCRLAGLRLGEALRLTWADVDHEKNILTVRHEGQQDTKHRARTVPMVPQLQTEMAKALEKAEDGETRVCPLHLVNLHRNMRIIVKRAGLDRWKKQFHTLRKNCESDWLAKYPVMAVCDWLGHDPAVAARHYHQVGADLVAKITGASPAEDVESLKKRIAELENKLLAAK